MLRAACSVAVLLSCCTATAAVAQETRAAVLARERQAKAASLRPYSVSKLERALLYIEEADPFGRIAPHNGFYLQYGYTGKPIGSGVAFGGGWRHDVFGRHGRIQFEAGQSFRGYRMGRADFSFPYLFDERLEVGVEGSYQRNPQEDFYGLGFTTVRGARVSFNFEAPEIQGRLMLKPLPWLNAGMRVGHVQVEVGRGTDSRYPSIEDRFTPADVPGLAQQPDYTYRDFFATIDTRDQPGNARDGSYLGFRWRRYNDRDFKSYSFDAVDIDAQQFLPIFDKKRVIAVRARIATTSADPGHQVPFYFQPTLGGSESLRSYSDFRFRDRNLLATNVEYRWEAFSGLDMALFADFGAVAPRAADLEFADARGAYGLGLRFNTYKAVFLRLDIAAGGSEGIRTFLKFSKAF